MSKARTKKLSMFKTAAFSCRVRVETMQAQQLHLVHYMTRTGFVHTDKLEKQMSTGSSPKSSALTWVDVLSLPLPANKDRGHTKTDEEEEQHR